MSDVLTLENRKLLKLSGVKEVAAFCEKEIKLVLVSGDYLFIRGENLKIDSFSKENGEFKLSGIVNEIKYKSKHELFGRVFK